MSGQHPALPSEPAFQPALAAHQSGRLDEAAQGYRTVLAGYPQHWLARANLGTLVVQQGQLTEGVELLRAALETYPEYVHALNSLGYALYHLGDFSGSEKAFEQAVALKPDFAEAYGNWANLRLAMRDVAGALRYYEQATQLKPDFADAQFNRATTLLLQGEFEAGWAAYEWRWQISTVRPLQRQYARPLWLGRSGDGPIAGKRIFLYAEQGLGDTLQFVRYVRLLEQMGAHVILGVPPALVALLQSVSPELEVVSTETALPAFDCYCPLMSLPWALRTRLETVPAKVPYLYPSEQMVDSWQTRLSVQRGLKVGLVWAGSKAHLMNYRRSLSLAALEPLLHIGAHFHCLQKEIQTDDLMQLKHWQMAGLEIQTHADALTDFAQTAGLVAAMDLVITVDTSVAHLAGAMGKPVWILLPDMPDFRWLLNRTDSVWYPTARLFRQTERGDWAGVVAQVQTALAALC